MRLASSLLAAGEIVEDAAEPFLGRHARALRHAAAIDGTAIAGAVRRRVPIALNGTAARKASSSSGGMSSPAKRSHSCAVRHRHRSAELLHLIDVHEAGMIVLMAGEGQAVALDRVGDEAGRDVVVDAVEGLEHRLHVVAGEIGHEGVELVVVELVEDAGGCRDSG